jgi:hypothetical protein
MSARTTLRSACLALAALLTGCGGGSSKPAPTAVYLFAAAKHDCNLGGRAGADAIARAGLPSALIGKTVHAFLSTSAADDIASMPATYGFPSDVPVVNPDGTITIADDWAGLLAGSLPRVLAEALGTNTSVGEPWWSGSESDGTLAAYTCSDWSDASGRGEAGVTSSVGSAWIDVGDYPGISDGYVLGIAY